MSEKQKSKKWPPDVIVKKDKNIITETRSYKLITPLYGGGVEPEKADPITVVRATEIRGHLRFWWRATRGGAYPKLEAMRRAEEEIWGSAAGKDKPGPSKVIVNILGKPTKKHNPTSVDALDQKGLGYAAFPLRETDDKPAGSVWEDVTFTAEFRYDRDYKEDVETALWAWETFGGIGARARRGFGALQLLAIKDEDDNVITVNPITANELRTEIKKELEKISGVWPAGVPHLSNTMLWETVDVSNNTNYSNDENGVWQFLIDKLKAFRQHRRPKDGKPRGRSHWPEPEAIRKITGDRLPKHGPLPNPVDKFPRGQFGLPIIFKFFFKDEKGYRGQRVGDPKQTSLQGKEHDRLASPLILRPLACAEGAVGLAAILEWEPVNSDEAYTPPGGLRLQGEGLDKPVESELTAHEAAQIPILKIEPDVLKAFLEYLTKGK